MRSGLQRAMHEGMTTEGRPANGDGESNRSHARLPACCCDLKLSNVTIAESRRTFHQRKVASRLLRRRQRNETQREKRGGMRHPHSEFSENYTASSIYNVTFKSNWSCLQVNERIGSLHVGWGGMWHPSHTSREGFAVELPPKAAESRVCWRTVGC